MEPTKRRVRTALCAPSAHDPKRLVVIPDADHNDVELLAGDEMIQAIVGMWRKVGIEANIETYEIAKHFELRTRHALAPAAFYNWGNSIGDPSTSTGFAMFSHSPHSAWKTEDVDKLIGPLWGETDEARRIAGYRAADRYIAEQGYVIPLLQYFQPVLHRSDLKFTPHVAGFILPQAVRPA